MIFGRTTNAIMRASREPVPAAILAGWKNRQGFDWMRAWENLRLCTIFLIALGALTLMAQDLTEWVRPLFRVFFLACALPLAWIWIRDGFKLFAIGQRGPGYSLSMVAADLKGFTDINTLLARELHVVVNAFESLLAERAGDVLDAEQNPNDFAIKYQLGAMNVTEWARGRFKETFERGKDLGLIPIDATWDKYFTMANETRTKLGE